MKLIAESLPTALPFAGGPFGAMPPPAWPLLDAIAPTGAAAEAREPERGTLVQLFGGLGSAPRPQPAPVVPPLPAVQPPAPAAGPFPATWPALPVAAPPGPAALVPASQVTAPLTDLLQTLGRASGPNVPAFAALRQPGGGGSW
ncbi:MAG: hypothetical protein ACOYOH_19955 [Paracraurococcus sp.]